MKSGTTPNFYFPRRPSLSSPLLRPTSFDSTGQRRTRRASCHGGACPPAALPCDRDCPYAIARVGCSKVDIPISLAAAVARTDCQLPVPVPFSTIDGGTLVLRPASSPADKRGGWPLQLHPLCRPHGST
jgi:hypothetical protein